MWITHADGRKDLHWSTPKKIEFLRHHSRHFGANNLLLPFLPKHEQTSYYASIIDVVHISQKHFFTTSTKITFVLSTNFFTRRIHLLWQWVNHLFKKYQHTVVPSFNIIIARVGCTVKWGGERIGFSDFS